MKRITLFAALILAAAAAEAQAPVPTSFGIGPRISNYSTDFDAGPTAIDTSRQSGYGLVGDYRAGTFILDWRYNHDPENGFSLSDIVVDVGNYEHNGGEATIGFAVTPILDLQGGARIDSIRVGGARFFGGSLFEDLDLDHQAIAAGVQLHSGDHNPVGWYVIGRGYLGSAKFDRLGTRVTSDTTGYRGEAGVRVRLAQSNWYVVPGLEYERFSTKDYEVDFRTNRVFLNFEFRR